MLYRLRFAILAGSFLTSMVASADCLTSDPSRRNILCTSYDFGLPVNIVNTTASPALTVMGGAVGIGTTTPGGILDVHATGTATSGNNFANRVQYAVNPSSASSAQFRSVQTGIEYQSSSNSTGGIIGYSSDVVHWGTGNLGSMCDSHWYLLPIERPSSEAPRGPFISPTSV